ncbi:MAG TPA: OprD family outer membrane porin [Chthoniobacter sp.]|nr:OprD family outer membrane porin [Chthoniobacter sp.]
MTIRTSPRGYAYSVLVLLAVLRSADAAVGQQQSQIDTTAAAPSTVTTPGDSDEAATSSTEQGRTPLPDSFQTWREWRIEKRRGAFEDTEFRFNIRTFYFDQERFDGSVRQAFTVGGWAGLKTGYFLDHIAFGVTGYTSQKLVGDLDRDGTSLLKPGQIPYTVLGEAYADIRIIKDLNVYVGRKEFDTPFINGNDTRMTPNTFEAVALQGKISFGANEDKPSPAANEGKTSVDAKEVQASPSTNDATLRYGAGYFDRIKEKNADRFISMSRSAGASVNRGVYTAGALFEKGNFSIGGIDYYSQDIINIAYAETKLTLPITADWKPKLSAQFVDQRSVGEELLQGGYFSGRQFGVKADVPFWKALLTVAYTYTTDGTDLRSPWGGYPGYTSVQVQDFFRAGEGALLVRGGYDFPKSTGLSVYALAVFGTKPSDPGQFAQNEYNANLQWSPPEGVLKGFSLRVRYALVQQDGGDVHDLRDLRVICNYTHKF